MLRPAGKRQARRGARAPPDEVLGFSIFQALQDLHFLHRSKLGCFLPTSLSEWCSSVQILEIAKTCFELRIRLLKSASIQSRTSSKKFACISVIPTHLNVAGVRFPSDPLDSTRMSLICEMSLMLLLSKSASHVVNYLYYAIYDYD